MSSDRQIHLGNGLDPVTLDSLADFICGDSQERFPKYRSSSYLTRFFHELGISAIHDGSTRKYWVLDTLKQLQPSELELAILKLTDLREYRGDQKALGLALRSMNSILVMDGLGVGIYGARPILIRAAPLNLNEDELLGSVIPSTSETDFLRRQFDEHILVADLGIDPNITPYLQDRIDEVQASPKDAVALGIIFLLGSTLEGLLLAVALENKSKFMSSISAPKNREGNTLKIGEWRLSQLIDVAHEIGLLDLDVKKFSHVLRDFRNYIHPYQQMSANFRPSRNTVEICWQVFKAAFDQLRHNLLPAGSSSSGIK